MFVGSKYLYPRLPLVLKHPIQEQPDSSMPKNAKGIDLHPKKRIIEYLFEGVQTNKLTNKKVMVTQLTQTNITENATTFYLPGF